MQNLDSVVNDIIVIGAGGAASWPLWWLPRRGRVFYSLKRRTSRGVARLSLPGVSALLEVDANARRKSRTVRSSMPGYPAQEQ